MPKLLVIYDPTGVLDLKVPPGMPEEVAPAMATIDVSAALEPADIATVAAKVVALLLEQMT